MDLQEPSFISTHIKTYKLLFLTENYISLLSKFVGRNLQNKNKVCLKKEAIIRKKIARRTTGAKGCYFLAIFLQAFNGSLKCISKVSY